MHSNSTEDRAMVSQWKAVAQWYQAYFTGLVLYVVSRKGTAKAEEFVYQVFSRQRRERFLPGLKKLGLDSLPHAVAAAQYHYLSNHIGGVSVQTMVESDRKAWIRYGAPRWLWAGTALCGIPPAVSKAMLAGWHAQNGAMLNNPRLGFVCTKQTVDGQSGLEGYYYEYDHDLAPHETLRFARHEDAPDFDSQAAPKLSIDAWPKTRLAKAHRNYAMEYIRSAYPTALQLWGPEEAAHSLRMTGRMIGMQFYHELAEGLGGHYQRSARGFAQFIADLGKAHGDPTRFEPTTNGFRIEQDGSAFLQGLSETDPLLPGAWNGLIEGALMAHNHRLSMTFEATQQDANYSLVWLLAEHQ